MAASGYPDVMQDVYREVLQCAVKNDVEGIRKMVKMGCPPTFANGVGQTVLHIGSLWGSVEAVQELLKLRADVHAQNKLRGSTPLHSAATGRGPADQRAAVIKLLLEARANPATPDTDGAKPVELADTSEVREALGAAPLILHKAVRDKKADDLAAAIQKVKSGAIALDLEEKDADGVTALHFATGTSWRKGLELLITAGASACTQAHNGETPLHSAVQKGDNLSVKALLEARADVGARDEDRDMDPRFASVSFEQDPSQHRTALHYAAQLGNVVAMTLLLGANSDPNLRDSQQQTALHLALEARDKGDEFEVGSGVRIVGVKNEKLMGSLGAIIGAISKPMDGVERWPVLVDGHPGDGFLLKAENLEPLADEPVKALLEARADVNLGSHILGESRTVLHEAARKGDASLVSMVVSGGAALNQQDQKQGFSPLHMAARSRHIEVARLLLGARAELGLKSGTGLTAAELAEKNGGSAPLLALLRGEAEVVPATGSPAPAAAVALAVGAGGGGRPQSLANLSPEERAALFLD